MGLRLICGPAGAGKTHAAIEAFREALDQGGNPVFIAPSAPDVRHFKRRLLRHEGIGAISGGAVTTFKWLCGDLLAEAGLKLKVLDDTERLMLLRAVVDGTPGLEKLGGSAAYEGFVRALARLISELQALGVEPAKMAGALSSWAGGNQWRRGLNNDLFRLYQDYRVALADCGAYDSELFQRQALEKLTHDPSLLSHETVIVDGFGDFTPMEHELLEALADAAGMVVTLPYAKGQEALAAAGQHFRKLSPGAEVEYLGPRLSEAGNPVLGHIAANLFEEDAPLLEAGDTVTILTGAGDRGQAELVAAEVLRLARAGQLLDDVAVVYRSLAADAAVMAAVFDEFGVPFEMAAPVPLASTPLGSAALALLECAAGGGRESLMRYLRSTYLALPPGLVDELDRRIRLKGSEDLWEIELELKELKGPPLDEIRRLQEAAASGLAALGGELAGAVGSMAAAYSSSSGADTSAIDVLALKGIVSVCREAAPAGAALSSLKAGGAAATAEEACHFLSASIRAAEVRLPAGNRRGCVRLLDPHRILNQNFDVVFVCGLLEGRFPTLGREDSFLSDRDRRLLGDEFGLPLETRDRQIEKERFLFHRTLTRARNRVYLCYPYCDREGSPSIRSLFVDDLLDIFEKNSWDRVDKDIGSITFESGQAPTEGQALRSLALLWSENGDGSGDYRKKLEAAAGPAGLQKRLAACIKAAAPREPRLSDAGIKKDLKEQDTFHVTNLESYLRCPYAYFLGKVISPADFEESASYLIVGSVLHKVLDRLATRMRSATIPSLSMADEEQIAFLRKHVKELLNEELAGSGLDGGVQGAVYRAGLGFHLNRFIDRERACSRNLGLEHHELEFGTGRGRHSVGTMLRLGDSFITGRIDRVDREEGTDRAVVIDYKSGSTSGYSHMKFEEKGIIQIPLYMMAVREIWGLNPVGGEYYSLKGSERRGLYLGQCRDLLDAGCDTTSTDFVDDETFAERLQMAEKMAIAAIKGIRAGRFPRDPVKGIETCSWCDFQGICRKPARAANFAGAA